MKGSLAAALGVVRKRTIQIRGNEYLCMEEAACNFVKGASRGSGGLATSGRARAGS